MKRLMRSKTNKMVAGVLAGIGEYFNVDPVLVRILFVFSTFISGLIPGILAYVIAVILMPEDNKQVYETEQKDEKGSTV